jgi:hypothetical protein
LDTLSFMRKHSVEIEIAFYWTFVAVSNRWEIGLLLNLVILCELGKISVSLRNQFFRILILEPQITRTPKLSICSLEWWLL